jgi:hypothetical protein
VCRMGGSKLLTSNMLHPGEFEVFVQGTSPIYTTELSMEPGQ